MSKYSNVRNINNGPDKERLIDTVFDPQKGIRVTFVLDRGERITGVVTSIGPDYQRDGESWIIDLHDSSATLGPMWLKCRYNSRTRKGEILVESSLVT